MKQHLETGAPANAKLLEKHAADAEQQVTRTRTTIATIIEELPKHDGNDEKQKSMRSELDILHSRLLKEYDLWIKLSKQVLDFDKNVSEQRRDGEKISRTDVERLLTNAWRFQRIGRENFIVSISQEAIQCKDEMDFYAKFANSIRLCEETGLRQGIENEKFYEWVLTCYEKSL